MTDPTRTDGLGSDRTSWAGRTTPPPPPVPAPSDPFWPPLEADVVRYPSGYPVLVAPRQRRSGPTVLLVVGGVLAACCAGGAALALLANGAFNGRTSLGSAPPGLNTPVADGKFQFIVTAMSCGHESVGQSFVTKKPQGQFCIVDLSVENIGTKAQTFSDGYQRGVGPDGTVYGTDSEAGVITNQSAAAVWNLINPGNKVTGKIVYDIPRDAQITQLELHDSAFSGGVSVTVG